jgi:hypothetical protein
MKVDSAERVDRGAQRSYANVDHMRVGFSRQHTTVLWPSQSEAADATNNKAGSVETLAHEAIPTAFTSNRKRRQRPLSNFGVKYVGITADDENLMPTIVFNEEVPFRIHVYRVTATPTCSFLCNINVDLQKLYLTFFLLSDFILTLISNLQVTGDRS